MEFYQMLIEKLHLDLVIIALVIASGFFQETYLCGLRLAKDDRYDAALKTLIISAVVSATWVYLISDTYIKSEVARYFLSYVTATSAYEIVIRPIRKWLKNSKTED